MNEKVVCENCGSWDQKNTHSLLNLELSQSQSTIYVSTCFLGLPRMQPGQGRCGEHNRHCSTHFPLTIIPQNNWHERAANCTLVFQNHILSMQHIDHERNKLTIQDDNLLLVPMSNHQT